MSIQHQHHSTYILVRLCLALAFTLLGSASLGAQVGSGWPLGVWEGTLATGGQELQIVYHIVRDGDDALVGTMDIPAQGATGISLTDVRVDGRELSFAFSVPGGGSYVGRLADSGTEIDGEFTQGQVRLPLVLEKAEGVSAPAARPQEPREPLQYSSEDIVFSNPSAGVELAGTMTLPEGDGPFPAVVLVSGAGAQDRDGAMFGHRPMLVLADHLTRNGIAVLRFADRGTDGSGGDFSAMTPQELASDVLAAVSALAARSEVSAGTVGILGHSDGARAAAMAVQQFPDAAFLVMLAGAARPGIETVAEQAERVGTATGMPDAVNAMNGRLYSRLAAIALAEADPAVAAPKMQEAARLEFGELPVELRRALFGDVVEQVVEQMVGAFNGPWTRFTLRHDPRETLAEVHVPVLAVVGDRDLQVSADALEEIERVLNDNGNSDVTTRLFPGLNHFMQEADTGSPTEAPQIEQTISPRLLDAVSSWILTSRPHGR